MFISSVLVLNMPVQRLFAGELFTTMRAKGFVAFAMVSTLYMQIHGLLGLVCFETMFKNAVQFYCRGTTLHFMVVFSFYRCVELHALSAPAPVLLVALVYPFLVLRCFVVPDDMGNY